MDSFNNNNFKNPCSFDKKKHFSYLKIIFQKHVVISRAIFLLFWPFLISKVLEVYFDLCLFFSWIKIYFTFQKALADFFLVKPLPLQQPPETKLLISVCLLKGQKFVQLPSRFRHPCWQVTRKASLVLSFHGEFYQSVYSFVLKQLSWLFLLDNCTKILQKMSIFIHQSSPIKRPTGRNADFKKVLRSIIKQLRYQWKKYFLHILCDF